MYIYIYIYIYISLLLLLFLFCLLFEIMLVLLLLFSFSFSVDCGLCVYMFYICVMFVNESVLVKMLGGGVCARTLRNASRALFLLLFGPSPPPPIPLFFDV